MLEREAKRRCRIEIGGTAMLYFVVLSTSILVGRTLEPSLLRKLLLLSPLIPLALAVFAVARAFGRMDEFVRLKTLELIAISAAVTSGWTITYGFLEISGFPRLSMFVVAVVMGLVFGILTVIRKIVAR
jgi:hypothetical protein